MLSTAETTPVLTRLPGRGQGLLGFWPMDGTGEDLSAHGFDGAAANAEWAVGRYGFAFRFDGDDEFLPAPARGG